MTVTVLTIRPKVAALPYEVYNILSTLSVSYFYITANIPTSEGVGHK
jgi:hypothetical protein